MLKIILKNEEQLENNPEIGMNLDTKKGIEEVLCTNGRYTLFTETNGMRYISKHDVKEIVKSH